MCSHYFSNEHFVYIVHITAPLFVQMVFQVFLLSDGLTSFASFAYANLDPVKMGYQRVVGFNAGDHTRSDVIFNRGRSGEDVDLPNDENIFRIDGEVNIIIV